MQFEQPRAVSIPFLIVVSVVSRLAQEPWKQDPIPAYLANRSAELGGFIFKCEKKKVPKAAAMKAMAQTEASPCARGRQRR